MEKINKDHSQDYQKKLASLIECAAKQDAAIEHEWLLDNRIEAVKLANYLRGHGYQVENKIRKPIGIPVYYVGVPFSSLKNKS